MVSLYLGEDAFLGSHEIGTYAQFRFSSCKGFLLPPHPQVISPVSRKRFARSSAGSLILVNCSGYAREGRLCFFWYLLPMSAPKSNPPASARLLALPILLHGLRSVYCLHLQIANTILDTRERRTHEKNHCCRVRDTGWRHGRPRRC